MVHSRSVVTIFCSVSIAFATPVSEAKVEAPDLSISFSPYFSSGLVGRAQRLSSLGQYAAAIKVWRRHLARRGTRHRRQAEFLLAYALLRDKQLQSAAAMFRQLQHSYPLLADYSRLFLGRAYYGLRRFSAALNVLAKIDAAAPVGFEAELVRADSLTANGQVSKSAAIWRRYLRSYPRGARAAEAHLLLARAAQRGGQPAASSAIAHYRAIIFEFPLSSHVVDARRALRRIEKIRGRKLPPPSAKQRARRALVFFHAARNARAEKELLSLSKSKALEARARCRLAYYLADSVERQRQRKRAAPLFSKARQLCRHAKWKEFQVKSHYKWGRALFQAGDLAKATRVFLRLRREHPSHSYADDALIRASEALIEQRFNARARRTLERLLRLYPRGDMVREAIWRLAKTAYFDRRFARALRYLEKSTKLSGKRRYYEAGRAEYWRGRVLAARGKRSEARQSYTAAIEGFPLSYYALLSFSRLSELFPDLYRRLRNRLVSAVGPPQQTWPRPPRSIGRSPSFLRGVELARLGFGRRAARELRRDGVSTSPRTAKSKAWVAAALYHGAGLWSLSHRMPRRRDPSFADEYPLAENFWRWSIAYPRAYRPYVEQQSKASGVPSAVARAVMREESGFSPRVESYANAIGLMQLILPTARSAAVRAGLPRPGRPQLHDPETNITLGCNYLGWLRQTFNGDLVATIAAYNAGQGAVFRWLTRLKVHSLDEFVERIPYYQTRRYTKRVLASYFAYSALYGAAGKRLPLLANQLPKFRRRRF